MSSADQSLKRTASPEAEEAQPNKRQKPDDNSDVPGAVAQIDESDAGAAPAAAQNQPGNNGNNEGPGDGGGHDDGGSPGDGGGPDDGEELEDMPDSPKKKIRVRSKWDEALDDFVKRGNRTGCFTDSLHRKGHNNRPPMSPDERRGFMEELEGDLIIDSSEPLGEGETEEESTREGSDQSERAPSTGEDHTFTATSYAPVDSLDDSASFLGVDLSDLGNIVISPSSSLRLRADQVQSIAFIVKNAEGILQGVVNSNPHGTGKTVEALASVFFLAQRRQSQPGFDAHKTTLILASHQALRGWQQVHAQFFSSLLTLYICTKQSQDLGNSQTIPLSASGLAATLDSMDSSDPHTSSSVILCTYDDFSSKEFLTKRKRKKLIGKKKFFTPGSQLEEEAHEALQAGRKPVLFDLNFKQKTLKKIGTLIADEAHEIKDPRTQKSQATYLVDADFNLLITASPADNRISDFRGLLFLLFKSNKWRFKWACARTPEDMLHLYSDAFDPLEGKEINDVVPDSACPQYVEAMRRGQHLWRLNPHAYRWLGNKMKFNTEFSRVVLGALFRLVVLRRDPEHLIEFPDGSNRAIRDIVAIPKTTIKTVELQMTAKQQTDFYDLADPWFSRLSNIVKEEERSASHVSNKNEVPITSFDQTENARLNYVTADFGLSDVFRLPGNSFGSYKDLDPKSVLKAHEDAGMTFYYMMTRHSTDPAQPPADRVAMLRHLVRRSPKLKWLLVTLDRLKQRKEKAIIFCYHPRTQWIIEGVCAMAEFTFYSLNHTHNKNDIRPKVIVDFNDPNKPVDFLLSTMELLGHGYDLSKDCHHMIIFEQPHSIPQMISAIGRIRRVGQSSEQEISILTLAGSLLE